MKPWAVTSKDASRRASKVRGETARPQRPACSRGVGTLVHQGARARGQPLEQVDPLGRTRRFAWDTEDRLTAIENPRHERARFAFDLAGNLARIVHYDGSLELARYAGAARLVSRLSKATPENDSEARPANRQSNSNCFARQPTARQGTTAERTRVGPPLRRAVPKSRATTGSTLRAKTMGTFRTRARSKIRSGAPHETPSGRVRPAGAVASLAAVRVRIVASAAGGQLAARRAP
jgi:YD repeat-containing protein